MRTTSKTRAAQSGEIMDTRFLKQATFIFGTGAVIIACTTGFNYRFYGLRAESYEGTLLGSKPAEDVALKRCEPDAAQKGKCLVIFVDEYERLLSDVATLQEQLKACQEGR